MTQLKIAVLTAVLIVFSAALCEADSDKETRQKDPIKVGWIGAMSGAAAKYRAQEAALLAQDDVNAAGGILGRPLELIFEDGKGDSRSAVNAAMKLINESKVNFVVGGHCSPESIPIAPIASRAGVLMLAAITSSPKLTDAGDTIFRVTAVSTVGVDLQTDYAQKHRHKRFAIIYEETDYAIPLAERFRDNLKRDGGEVTLYDSFLRDEHDFRSLVTRLKAQNVDAIYLGVQSPDSAVIFLQQLKELGVKAVVYGNELTGNAVSTAGAKIDLFDGMVFPEPILDLSRGMPREFVERFKARFGGEPFGFWSAEAYDAVRLLASIMSRCGTEIEQVKRCLYDTKDYEGASGTIGFDKNGDGVRHYQLKVVSGGVIQAVG